MKMLAEYFNLQKQIYEYFGYEEEWVVIPLDDGTDYFWHEDGNVVCFSDNEEELTIQTGNYYENEIYTQRFLSKWVYRGEEYTMICVDTQVDGNKFLQIFDNSKERKPLSEAPTIYFGQTIH